MQILKEEITFPEYVGGPLVIYKPVDFHVPITRAIAVPTGIQVSFSHNKDHHLGNLIVDLHTSEIVDNPWDPPSGVVVPIQGTLGLSDSGNWHDPYEGHVSFALIVQ